MLHHTPAPIPIYLCGSKPGVFDPTQPSRLLRYPDSTLLFASFNPPFFSGTSLSADKLSRASCIVVEVPCANDAIERPNWFSFVPKAVLAPGVTSEGKWPRLVDYCGRWVFCDQDQWDIHKLDPAYDCFVPTTGMHPTITRKIDAQFPGGGTQICPGKREFSPSSPEEQDSGNVHSDPDVLLGETTSAPSTTFTASAPSGGFASSGSLATLLSEDSWRYLISLATRSSSTLDSSTRPILSSSTATTSPLDSSTRPISSSTATTSPVWPGATDHPPKRRKATVPSPSVRCPHPSAVTAKSSGPTQPVPESSVPLASVFTASAPDIAPASASLPHPTPLPISGPEMNAGPDDDAAALHPASVMESPRQMAPAHQATSAQVVLQDTTADESHRPQAVADVRARDQDLYVRLGPEIRRRWQEQREQWMPWPPRVAIDRYVAISSQFDTARFSLENPVDPSSIPWPVLLPPFTFQVARLEGWMVEAFFKEAYLQMSPEDYRKFVAESLRRFHPDRWHSRGILKTHDKELSQVLEQACTTIAQVLSQIWDTLKFTPAQN
ncbi:hypothetical protein GSI_08515 [Ganoderma sinense ZZ0214-1]|uniref:Uncharacterized protein n=1 Tax=Ganoderma sinense ZZ0214-1 TaxID=1077348 RepID=A0A2G8S420_9APHY|nr:hypothetical protein GSI_08515 [Ganoderma sinense ZZ0214-1]